MAKARPLAERFWEKVDKSGDCWLWMGSKSKLGYGGLSVMKNGKATRAYAHRTSYELTYGPIPAGMHVCHSCDNPQCVNPAHLWLGTATENMADRDRKGRGNWRAVSGERAGAAKLTWEQVRAIRKERQAGATKKAIAERFGIAPTTVYYIANNLTWKE